MSPLIERTRKALVVLLIGLPFATDALAGDPRRFDLFDGKGGATCEYFNRDALLKWKHRQGDWSDLAGTARGPVPISTATIRAGDPPTSWDVTALTRAAIAPAASKQLTVLLKVLDDSSVARAFFASREAVDEHMRPQLSITGWDGKKHAIPPLADTMLQCSTARSLGGLDRLTVAGNSYAALQFDLQSFSAHQIGRAQVELIATEVIGGPLNVGLFRLDIPYVEASTPQLDGIAAKYPSDSHIEHDPDVIMATGFEEDNWLNAWGNGPIRGTYVVAGNSPRDGSTPVSGRALRVTIPKGENLGLDLAFAFKEQIGSEPEEIYFRYYLLFTDSWRPVVDGGKLPGMSGTYGVSGWGGRRSDGSTGWSMRGQFYRQPENANPMSAWNPIGTYAYHADTQDNWGDAWPWTANAVGLLERNRWYCIEQYVRLNTPGVMDGVLRAWVDGVTAFDRTDIRYRNTSRLRIEKVWMNVYHGGKAPAAADMQLLIDNVVIARRYIGPVATTK